MTDSRLLDVMENVLLATPWPYALKPVAASAGPSLKARAAQWLDRRLVGSGIRLAVEPKHLASEGVDWPSIALTMIGQRRLRNVRHLCATVEAENIPGAWVECGVWRGGASIMARYCLAPERTVYLCDSFQGLPFDPSEPQWARYDYLKVSEDEVRGYFKAFCCDDNVQFVKGWFKDTLPNWETPIAILRCDGDMYSSTMQILGNLYDWVNKGGFVIIDDFNLSDCQRACEHYWKMKGIKPQLIAIDQCGVYWRKT